MSAKQFIWGLGRRKTSVARVRIAPGTGEIKVNDKKLDDYVKVERLRKLFNVPGQIGACMLGISRALIKAEPNSEAPLRRHGLLTRDSRMVERKKYGLRGARRGCQFSKR
jgi:small subunit ribosomal protein S9